MDYLCLIFREAEVGLAGAEGRAADDGGVLRARIVLGAQAIGAANSAITLRVRGAELSLAEGSAGLPRDPAPSYRLLDAMDLNDAIRLASLLPEALAGRLELRPIHSGLGGPFTSLRR